MTLKYFEFAEGKKRTTEAKIISFCLRQLSRAPLHRTDPVPTLRGGEIPPNAALAAHPPASPISSWSAVPGLLLGQFAWGALQMSHWNLHSNIIPKQVKLRTRKWKKLCPKVVVNQPQCRPSGGFAASQVFGRFKAFLWTKARDILFAYHEFAAFMVQREMSPW